MVYRPEPDGVDVLASLAEQIADEVTRQAANAALSQILPEGGDRRGR